MADIVTPPPPADDKDKIIADLKAENEKLKAKPAVEPSKDSPSLEDQARKTREANEAAQKNQSTLESALNFNIKSQDWLKTNSSLLPKTVEGIFTAAEKEKYKDAIEKASAIKVGLISEFFAVQSNVDLLTGPQKVALEDFKNLTKNDKQDRVTGIYDTLFEPTFESLKKIKKAEQVSKGLATTTDAQSVYKKNLENSARRHYLGEKNA